MRFDKGGKTEGVIARKLFRKLGIALFQGLNDGQMFGKGSCGAVRAPDRQLPIASHMKKDIVGHIHQNGRLAE